MSELTHFSLCSGIGGLDLAAEWAGFRTVGQCEIDGFASARLADHFIGVPNFGDVRTITNDAVRAAGIGKITALSAGFPCQPYSLAGHGAGDGDERDLWPEVVRCISELDPDWVVLENTPGLFARANQRYFHRVVNDLSKIGRAVAWSMWGACHAGAVHSRERVFFVAHAVRIGRHVMGKNRQARCAALPSQIHNFGQTPITDNAILRFFRDVPAPRGGLSRNDHGISEGMDRVRCLGNAVVPQQAFPIFEAIAEYERSYLS